MTFKSEIRDSTINGLLEKAAGRNYGQYLSRLVLKHIRGFENEPVSFDFPVTALIGPNGGGKTTILGAAGCAYKSISPKRFFAKSGKYDETMQDWAIEYELIDREQSKSHSSGRSNEGRKELFGVSLWRWRIERNSHGRRNRIGRRSEPGPN